jgi:hypothetical protein
MAENDKKGFSGLGELAPKKKNRVKVETESDEPQIRTPKQAEKKSTRESTQTQRTKHSYPKDNPYKSSLPKLSKNEWIGIFVIFFVLWLLAGKDNKPSAVFDDPPASNPYSQYDVPADPIPEKTAASAFGSIYWDPESDVFAWAVGYKNEFEAKSAAAANCNKRAVGVCELAYGGEVKCLAVAHGITKRAWALGETKEDAERNAIKTCYEGALETCTVPNQGSVCTEWQ